MESTNKKLTSESIQAWLVDYVAKILKEDAKDINPQENFKDFFAMDSITMLRLLADLSDFLECEDLKISTLSDYPTIEELSNHFSSDTKN